MPRADRRPSPIAGRGLFSVEPVAAGSALPDVDVDVLNHSCAPNLGWSGATLVALIDIDRGGELTVDYATFHAEPGFAMFCHCETYRCRQVIEGDDWRIPQLQQRYAGHWAPNVQALIDGREPADVQVGVVDGSTTRELRRAVLRPSWPVGSTMHGDDDPDAVHLAAVDAGQAVAACVLLVRRYPLRPELGAAWQLRGMAVAAHRQRQGIGGRLLHAALSELGRRGGRLVWCDARISAAGFYRSHGFVAEGPEFAQPETGLPHVRMWRELPALDGSSDTQEVRKSGRG